MPYLALYRKYRPQTFGEVYGQKAVIRTLENAFKENKIGHAYLFCGPRGTGKTSMARLFAKALNCSEGFGHQCCRCESCLAVASGNHPDVIEMDAASNSSVDDVRGIISQVDYQPIMGRYRVYIIDEVHNMSGSAFNALLKTLEEPPENVVFILCTTEPQKVLPTIISRVQRFDFSRVADSDLISDMESICQKEGVKAESDAIKKLAALADGGVRDALSLLDQAVSFSGDNITLRSVEDLFGLVDPKTLCDLLNLARSGEVSELVRRARALVARGMDISRATRDMAGICRDLLLLRAGGDPGMLNNLTADLAEQMGGFNASDCNRFLSTLIKGQRDYRYSVDLADAFEILLLQLAAPEAATSEAAAARGVVAQPAPAAPVYRQVENTPEPVSTPAISPSSTPVASPVKEEPVPAVEIRGDESSTPSVSARVKGSGISIETILKVMVNGDKTMKERFIQGWNSMASDDIATLNILKKCKPVVCSSTALLLSNHAASYCTRINKEANRDKIRAIIRDNFQTDIQVGAITDTEFSSSVEAFKKGRAEHTLPPRGEVDLFGEKAMSPEEKSSDSNPSGNSESAGEKRDEPMSNAARFFAALKEEN